MPSTCSSAITPSTPASRLRSAAVHARVGGKVADVAAGDGDVMPNLLGCLAREVGPRAAARRGAGESVLAPGSTPPPRPSQSFLAPVAFGGATVPRSQWRDRPGFAP